MRADHARRQDPRRPARRVLRAADARGARGDARRRLARRSIARGRDAHRGHRRHRPRLARRGPGRQPGAVHEGPRVRSAGSAGHPESDPDARATPRRGLPDVRLGRGRRGRRDRGGRRGSIDQGHGRRALPSGSGRLHVRAGSQAARGDPRAGVPAAAPPGCRRHARCGSASRATTSSSSRGSSATSSRCRMSRCESTPGRRSTSTTRPPARRWSIGPTS